MNSVGLRIFLYVVIAVCPDILVWLNNSFDFTARGLALITVICVKNAALTIRTYLDTSKSHFDALNALPPVPTVVTPPPPDHAPLVH